MTVVGPEETPERAETRVRFDQLVEALRFGGPPAESLIWEPEGGDLTVVTADFDSLMGSVVATAITAVRLRKILSGSGPSLTEGQGCGICPRFPDCPELHDA